MFVTLTWIEGTTERTEAIVLRLPPLVASFPDRDAAGEGHLLAMLASAGFAVPDPLAVEVEPSWFGGSFLVLPHLAGRAPAEVLTQDEWLRDGGSVLQARAHATFLEVLASIYAVDPATLGLPVPADPLAFEVDRWVRYVDWAADGAPGPAMAGAVGWLQERRPTTAPAPSLVWGDARLGNLLLHDDASLVAVLDWELATAGPAEMDLAWHLALDEMQTCFLGALPGMPDRAATVAAWQKATGRAPCDLAWHEVFALIRSTAVSDRQARLAVQAGETPMLPPGDASPMVAWINHKIAGFES